ncbi:MAG: PAS domain S-box protein [Acidobacteriota bacterium]
MDSTASQPRASGWLVENGSTELEMLLRAIERRPLDASAGNLPGLPPANPQIWAQDFAQILVDLDGLIVSWHPGAQRILGYQSSEVIGQSIELFDPEEDAHGRLLENLRRASAQGHNGREGPGVRKDDSRFWANTITMALKDEHGDLRGFGMVVRDFSERHEEDEKLRKSRARLRPIPAKSTIAGVVSGEFDQIPEANDTLLELVGYSREDLRPGGFAGPN